MTTFNINSNGYSTDLTEYNKDGLELFIHTDGSVYSNQTGIANMLGMQAGHLSSVVNRKSKTNNLFNGVARSKIAGKAGKEIIFYPVEVIVALAAEYCPKLAERFSLAGATVYLYQLAGYIVKPAVIAPATASLNELQLAVEMQKLLTDKIELLTYIADKPGLAHKIAQAHTGVIALPSESLSFDEMCDLRGIARYPKGIKQELSRKLANSVANDNLVKVGTKTVTKTREGKKPQYYTVNAYSVESLPHFDNVIKLYG